MTACGGSSASSASGGSSNSGTTTTKVSVNLTNALFSSVTNGIVAPSLSITGTYNNVTVTGTGSYTRAPATSTTFDGNPASSQEVTLVTGTLTETGGATVIVPNAVGYLYSSSALDTIGVTTVDSTGAVTEYDAATTPIPYPTTITVGASGALSTFNRFTDATMDTYLGSNDWAYSVLANGSSTNSVILQVMQQIYDSGSTNPTIITTDYVVTSAGVMTLQSLRITILGVQDLTYTAAS
jgi:hypothetical protein